MVTAVGNTAGFVINGTMGSTVLGGIGTTDIDIEFLSGPTAPDPWTFTAATAGLTFSPAATIANASGLTS